METAVVGQDIDARANLADRRGRTRHMGPSMAVPMAELVWWALNPKWEGSTTVVYTVVWRNPVV
jgi:hypothetical protein